MATLFGGGSAVDDEAEGVSSVFITFAGLGPSSESVPLAKPILIHFGHSHEFGRSILMKPSTP